MSLKDCNEMFLSLLVLIVVGANAYGDSVGNYEVIANVLNVRSEPSSNGEIIGKLTAKQIVQVVEFDKDWASIVFVGDSGENLNGYVKTEFIQLVSGNTNNAVEQVPQNKTLQYFFVGVFVFCVICYIIALIRTQQGKMIAIVNWYDFTLLIAPFILWIIAACCYNDNSDSNILSIVLFVIGLLCFIGSMIWSIIANKGSLFNMIVSIFAKLFVIMIVWLIVLYFIFRHKKTEKTESYNGKTYTRKLSVYEQEVEDAKHRRNTVAAIGIAGFLIFSLIGGINHKELTEKLKSKV
jgi:hypothetical protein